MPQNEDRTLIDRLDNNLSASDTVKVDSEIAADEDMATEWAYLKLAVDTVSLGAIREKVAAARTAIHRETGTPVVVMEKKETAVVRSMFARTAMRVAVAAVLILAASAIYKYSAVNSTTLYNNSFSEFELGTTRGNEAGDKMEAAYRSRNWAAVLSAFDAQTVKTNKSYFLAGMARMEMKNFPASVQLFETVLANNDPQAGNYFHAESEYYLALAYLMNNQTSKGLAMIRKIRSDIYHPYYPLASKIPATDLKIVEIKK